MHFSFIKNIYYLCIIPTVGDATFYLSPGISKNIKNLLPSIPYIFQVPLKENQSLINVTFTLINETIKPFNIVTIDEHDTKSSISTEKQLIANVPPENNKLKLSFYYLTSMRTDYIYIIVTPKIKIANLKIKINTDYCYYLNNGYDYPEIYPKNLTNLKSNINYYLFLDCFICNMQI